MAAIVSSGNTTVSGSVTTTISSMNAPPTAAQYVDLKSATRNDSTAATIYTVPAGKVAIVQAAVCAPYSAAGYVNAMIGGGTTYQLCMTASTALTSSSWSGSIKLVAGEYITARGQCVVSFYEITV